MTRRLAWVLCLFVWAGCRCRAPGPVDPVELGLRVNPSELDFGRVLEGDTKTATVTLTAETRAPVSVALSTDAPFSVTELVEVPGGGDAVVSVVFVASNEAVTGVLRLKVGELEAEVKLKGTGVRPLPCVPSKACVVSTYSLEEDRCLEVQAQDDAPCDPASKCLEQGRCRAGQCLGIARKCDDNDLCTDDACSMEVGCVKTPHVCPAPAAACKVATCDKALGCGVGPAPELQQCGTVDCTEVNFCLGGACTKLPTPEGQPCSPAIACLPQGECHSQQCTRPTQADWRPDWSTRLIGEPTGELASSGPSLFFSLCVDAGVSDAGVSDGGQDAGVLDDGGLPPRALVCGLSSYTGTGFERFTMAFDDDAPRAVLSVNDEGVVLLRDGGVEVRSVTSGALRGAFDFTGTRAQLAIAATSISFVEDGGLFSFTDGGATAMGATSPGAQVARGEALFLWDADAGLLTRFDPLEDGGLVRAELIVPDSSSTLAVAGAQVILGASGRAQFDAGFLSFHRDDAGITQWFEAQTLVSEGFTDLFFERCDAGCETWVRVVDNLTGVLQWEAPVLPSPGVVVGRTLVDGPPGAVAVLLRYDGGTGPLAEFQLLAEGERKATCRLPAGSGAVEAMHVSSSAVLVLVRRPDGRVVLESYGLNSLPVSRSGWPTVNGVGGTRADRR